MMLIIAASVCKPSYLNSSKVVVELTAAGTGLPTVPAPNMSAGVTLGTTFFTGVATGGGLAATVAKSETYCHNVFMQ